MRTLASYILTGRIQAVGIISAALGLSLILPPIGLLSSAAVALVTLRLGASEGLLVIGISMLLSAFLGGWYVGGAVGFAVYGGFVWLPSWLVALVLRSRVDLALALESAVVLASLAVIGIYLSIDNPAGLWSASVEFMTQRLLENPPPELNAEQIRRQVDLSAHYWTGTAAAVALLGVGFSLFVARAWQAQLFNPGGFMQEYLALRAHRPMGYAMLALLLTAATLDGQIAELARNLLLIGGVFYMVAGVSVLNSLGQRFALHWRWQVLIMFGILAVMPPLLVLVGWVDTWLDIRRWRRAV